MAKNLFSLGATGGKVYHIPAGARQVDSQRQEIRGTEIRRGRCGTGRRAAAGTQVSVDDVSGDGCPDILTTARAGTYLFFNN